MRIVGIRLIAGEDIVGRVHAEDENSITLSKPRQVVIVPVSQTQAQISLGPFIPFAATTEFRFPRTAIVTEFSVTPQMETQYIEMTSGLVMASPADIPKSGLIQP